MATNNPKPSEILSKFTTSRQARNFMGNAHRFEQPDLASAAQRKIIELEAQTFGPEDEFERDFYKALVAYEEVLRKKNGRKTRATRTRAKLARDGIVPTLTYVVKQGEKSYGLSILRDFGFPEYAFEEVVVKHPSEFDPETVKLALKTISAH